MTKIENLADLPEMRATLTFLSLHENPISFNIFHVGVLDFAQKARLIRIFLQPKEPKQPFYH
jgi:hypothetical protein